MQHTIQQLYDKVNAMRDLAIVAHRLKYSEPSVDHFDEITNIVENIRQMAGDIYNDSTPHPKVKAKQEDRAWEQRYPPQDFLVEDGEQSGC